MKLFQSLGDMACASILIVVASGTIAGVAQGKGFDGPAAIQFVTNIYNRLAHGTDIVSGRVAPTSETPQELVVKNVEALKKVIPIPSPVPGQPTNKATNIDLTKCLPGTSFPKNNLSAQQFDNLKKGTYTSLWDVQSRLGNPVCAISGNTWLYRSGEAVVTVSEEVGKVKVK